MRQLAKKRFRRGVILYSGAEVVGLDVDLQAFRSRPCGAGARGPGPVRPGVRDRLDRYWQLPPEPVAIVCAEPDPQVSVQVAPPPQLSEHEPEQVTSQVESSQLTLPLLPTTKSQVELAVQLRLALSPAVRVQVEPPLQPPLQEAPQVSLEQVPLGQVMSQLLPPPQPFWVQPLDPPQASSATATIGTNDLSAFKVLSVPRATAGPGAHFEAR